MKMVTVPVEPLVDVLCILIFKMDTPPSNIYTVTGKPHILADRYYEAMRILENCIKESNNENA